MKFLARPCLIIAMLCFAHNSHAHTGLPAKCAQALLPPAALYTIDNIISQLERYGRIRDCGPGCYEYSDSSHEQIPFWQREHERGAAAIYAETLLARDEGVLLLSRYHGYDIPAFDGLIFQLSTGNILARLSLKGGMKVFSMIEKGILRIHQYSPAGGKWADLAYSYSKKSRFGVVDQEAYLRHSSAYDKIAEIFNVDDAKLKTRIVLERALTTPLDQGLISFALKQLRDPMAKGVESIVFITGSHVYPVTSRGAP